MASFSFCRGALWLFVLLILSSVVFASEAVNVTIVETGRITNYFNQYWVVNTNGTITITNPTDRDLYDIAIKYDLGSLTIVEDNSTSYLKGGQMLVTRILPNSSVSANYNIVGISLVDPSLIDKGVLYSAMTRYNPVIYSDTFGQLQKGSLENQSITGRPGRVVSVTLQNPTGFQFTVDSMRVIKTTDLDPNTIISEWDLVNATQPLTLDANSLFVRDILDTNSADGEVYWLDSDVFISKVEFYDVSNISRYTELNLSIPPEFLNYTINTTNSTFNRSLSNLQDLYVNKIADEQIVTASSPVTITLLVNNFVPELVNFNITDTIPSGFVFVAGTGWSVSGSKLSYSGTVGGRAASVPSYQLRLVDTDTAGLDYFDSALVTYSGASSSGSVYSSTVPFIRQYLPKQQLYVQKKLQYVANNQVSVTLSVQNLGSTPVDNALLKDYLGDNDLFSQISQVPDEKGLWTIPEIKPNDIWEVTYITDDQTDLTLLPAVYGVPSGQILKSLVTENIVSAGWVVVKTASVEIVGIGLLFGLPIVFFFMRKRTPPPPAQ